MQEQMQKKSHARWCTNVEEDLGALGKHAAGKSHTVTAVWPFAKTGRKKGKRDLYQRTESQDINISVIQDNNLV